MSVREFINRILGVEANGCCGEPQDVRFEYSLARAYNYEDLLPTVSNFAPRRTMLLTPIFPLID